MSNPIERRREGSRGSPIKKLQTKFGVVNSVQNEMGNVRDKNLGFGEVRFEGVLPLVVGFKDSDGVEDEVVDAWSENEMGWGKGFGFGAVTGFDSRKNGL